MHVVLLPLLVLLCTARLHETRQPHADAARLHARYVEEFLDHEGFGWRRMAPTLPRQLVVGGSTWRVKEHRLIGLWKGDAPRLYLQPRAMQRSRGVETRPLDATEREAVRLLRAGADVHLAPPLLFGAIRARQSCLECHDVAVGTVLGAFRYELAPR